MRVTAQQGGSRRTLLDASRERDGGVGTGVWQHHREFLAAKAADDIAGPHFGAQERGVIIIMPGSKVYTGMIVGEHSREADLGVNICKSKQLSNMRTTSTDEALVLTPPRVLSLEQCLEYIEEDEMVEVTPVNIRLRKKVLDPNDRKKAEKSMADKNKSMAGK